MYDLGGNFTYFVLSSLLGKNSHFDEHIFQRGFETTNFKNQKFDRDHYSPNSNLLLQGSIFRGYVCFREDKLHHFGGIKW